MGWTLLAVALTAVGTVRAADWLAALCLMAAAAAAALAVARRSFRSLTMSLLAPGVAALRAVPVGRARAAHRPARGCCGPGAAVLSGGLVLLVFVPLLASADAAFSQVVDAVTPAIDGRLRGALVLPVRVRGGRRRGACFLLVAPPPEPYGRTRAPPGCACLDWALPTGVLVAVLALFVGVQFVVLFGSDDYVLRTTGLTYAEYARSGFWQLLAVTALALGVLALGSRWAPARTPAERAAKRGLLAALALLTLVVVASAINRMWLYQQAYGFTVLRLLVLTCELWLGAGFLLALVAVLRLRPGGLSRPMVAVGMLALLGLAVLDPERFIAAHNVARWSETGKLDTYYLGTSPPTRCRRWSTSRPDRACILATSPTASTTPATGAAPTSPAKPRAPHLTASTRPASGGTRYLLRRPRLFITDGARSGRPGATMLSGQDERAFAEIAEQIVADDPEFATSMRRLQSRRPGRVHNIVIVAAAATAVLCLLLSLGPATVVAATLAYATYRFRPSRPGRPGRPAGRPVRRRRRGFR